MSQKPIVVRPFADCSVSKRWVCQNGRPNCGSVISIRSATMLSSNASYGVRGKAKRYPAFIKYAVIVENKDTYQTMPPIAQGICIWGSGRAVSDAVPAVPALRDMRIVYWGDMDADGLEILSTLRESGIECDSILMDCDAYDRYHRFGTDRTERSAKIAMREPKPTPGLQSAERRLYERLCADKTIAYRRIEQERIPMRDAVDELRKLGIPVESIENQDLPI